MSNNNYVVVRKSFDVLTDVYYANTFEEAEAVMNRQMFSRAAEGTDVDSEWTIAAIVGEPVSKTERKFIQFMDWLRNKCGA